MCGSCFATSWFPACSTSMSHRGRRNRQILFQREIINKINAINNHAYYVQVRAVVLITIAQALCNHFGIRLTTALTGFFQGYLVLVVQQWSSTRSVPQFGVLAGTSPRLTTFVNNTVTLAVGMSRRRARRLLAFLIGLLYPLYTITSSMPQRTRRKRRAMHVAPSRAA